MSHDKKMLDREAVRSVIQQWNANRIDLFALSEPDENLLFHGVMRFYFQDAGQKVATKCIRVASDATVSDVIGKCRREWTNTQSDENLMKFFAYRYSH